jgi:hypothetical protein
MPSRQTGVGAMLRSVFHAICMFDLCMGPAKPGFYLTTLSEARISDRLNFAELRLVLRVEVCFRLCAQMEKCFTKQVASMFTMVNMLACTIHLLHCSFAPKRILTQYMCLSLYGSCSLLCMQILQSSKILYSSSLEQHLSWLTG